MPKDYLGLFDTPPSSWETRLGVVIVAFLFIALLIVLPARNVRLPEIVAFVPAINSTMFVAELIIATLLYAQAVIFRSRALTLLASGYVFIAALLIPHALTFPGAFARDGLLGAGVNSTAWIAIFRRLALPIAVGCYAWLKQADTAAEPGARRPAIATSAIVAILAAISVTLLATAGHDLLPPLFANRAEVIRTNLVIFNLVLICLTGAAMIAVFRQRSSVLDWWLLVALAAWLFQSVLNLPLQARFTLGFYSLFLMMMAATLIVLLALVAESSRLYVRLALSTSVQNREREARLMSMNAMAAASFQEVGQPLTAMFSSAMASKAWLTGGQPDREKAVESLDETIAAGRDTFEVMQSVRTKFTEKSAGGTQFSVNELLRATALSMDTELAARKVSLQFKLDESLPPVRGDRTQIQRVISYLMAKLFNSTRARCAQRILLRTAASGTEHLILDLSNSEDIEADEQMEQLFESVYDAKDREAALELSLCNTIIADYGGYLLASQGSAHGTTYRLKFPLSQPALSHEACFD